MRFAKDLYIDEAFSDSASIIRQLRYGYGKPKGYAIVRNENTGKLEGISFTNLKNKYYRNSRQEILEIWASYNDMLLVLAKDAVKMIIGESDPVIEIEEPIFEGAEAY